MHIRTPHKKIITRERERGFALIEIILALAIGAGTTVVGALCLGVILETEARMRAESTLSQEGMQAIDLIARKIRNADNVATPVVGESPTLTLTRIGDANPTTIAFHDERLWLTEDGAEIALTNTQVFVEEFTITKLANGTSTHAAYSVDLHMRVPLAFHMSNASTVDLRLRTTANMRGAPQTP